MPLSSLAPSDYPLTLSKHLHSDGCHTVAADRACENLAPHCLFSPIHYETGYAYPLIVWLHGPGDNENQLRTVLPLVSMRNHIAIGPRATAKERAPASGHATAAQCKESGRKESPGSGMTRATYRWTQTREEIVKAAQCIQNCIEIATSRYHIHRDRIFIAGYDCGGTMALRIALENPQIFAGAISLGGCLPRGLNLLRRVNEARKLPLLIANTLNSRKYSPKQACEDLRLLHAGGFSLDLRQYPCGDELTTKMLSDLDQWILNRIC